MFTKRFLVAAMVVATLGAGCGTTDGGPMPSTDPGSAMPPDMLGLPQADLSPPPQGNDASQAMTEDKCLALQLAPASCVADGTPFPPPCKFRTIYVAGTGICVAQCWQSDGAEPTDLKFDATIGMCMGSFSGTSLGNYKVPFTCTRE